MTVARARRKPGEKRSAKITVETDGPLEPVRVVHEFPPGTVVRPPGDPPKAIKRPVVPELVCPYCGTASVERASHKGEVVYYRCRRCVDGDTCRPSIFKAV